MEETLKEIIWAQNCLEGQTRKKVAQKKKLEKQIARLEERGHWIEGIVKPLAKAIKKVRGYHSFEILGPFGWSNDLSIWFWKNKEEAKEGNALDAIALHIQPNQHKLLDGVYYTTIIFTGCEGTEYPNKCYYGEDWSMDDILQFMDGLNNNLELSN